MSRLKSLFALCVAFAVVAYSSVEFKRFHGTSLVGNGARASARIESVLVTVTTGRQTSFTTDLGQPNATNHEADNRPTPPKCSPITKIVYVKTHKTAGTSINSMIRNHVEKYGRSMVKIKLFPHPLLGGYPGHFKAEYLANKNKQLGNFKPGVMLGHLRYDKAALENLMPRGTRYITILRKPAAVLRSTFFYYYGEIRKIRVGNVLVSCFNSPFIDILGKYNVSFSEYLEIAPNKINKDVPWYFRSLNHQAHDLGLDPTRTDRKYIDQQIKILESSFDLVLIAEYYLESLVLLRHELCMDWSILTDAARNQGRYEKTSYTANEQAAIRNLTKLDYALYNHFTKTFWRKIRAYGIERMAEDVKKIKQNSAQNLTDVFQDTEKQKKRLRMANEDISKYYNTKRSDMKRLLAERIVKNTNFSAKDPKVQKLSEYMIANSGGCNL